RQSIKQVTVDNRRRRVRTAFARTPRDKPVLLFAGLKRNVTRRAGTERVHRASRWITASDVNEIVRDEGRLHLHLRFVIRKPPELLARQRIISTNVSATVGDQLDTIFAL